MSARSQPGGSSDGIDNFQLPKALVTRIARSALPHDAKLQKDTISSLVNGASVFINYLAATAQDVAASRSRKTISGPDILKALQIIDFGDLVPPLEAELVSYHEVAKTDKGKGKGKEKGHSVAQPSVALPDEARQKDHESEPEHEILEDIEDQAEGGVDEDIRMVEADVQEDEEEEQEEEEEAGDEVEDDAADEPEEIVDALAIEEAELQSDAQGLEESGPKNDED